MTLLQAIEKLLGQAAGQIGGLKAILAALAAKFPDLAPELNPIIVALDAPIDPANLAALGAAIPGELLQIAQGKFDPRQHPGDAI